MADERNWLAGPTDMELPAAPVNGSLLLLFLADLPEGGAVNMEMPAKGGLSTVQRGPWIPPGAMLVVLIPEIATKLRPTFREHLARLKAGNTNGSSPGRLAHP